MAKYFQPILPTEKLRALTLIILFTFISSACVDDNNQSRNNISSNIRVGEVLESNLRGEFSSADRERKFTFPDDHDAHPNFKRERWQFSGNVAAGNGKRIGYQLSIQRIGLDSRHTTAQPTSQTTPNSAPHNKNVSLWRSKNLYMATLSITDMNTRKFYQKEKLSRNSVGLSGLELFKAYDEKKKSKKSRASKTANYFFHIDNWTVKSTGSEIFPLNIIAAYEGIDINITLYPSKDIKLHGQYGLSQQGALIGNASYYYTISRLRTLGQITINNQKHKIKGDSLFEHEWGTDVVGSRINGVDHYAMQLSDGREISFYRVRNEADEMDPLSRGLMIFPNGKHENIRHNEIEFLLDNDWTSPTSGTTYPTSWNIRIPKYRLSMHTTPLISEQEIELSQTYWNGTIRVAGFQNVGSTTLKTINGYGFMRLTGYKNKTDH